MDVTRVVMLRELLAGTGWVERTRGFARTLRRSTKEPGGLLLVGTPEDEPWHFAAHLGDEAQYANLPELAPTLVRYAPPPDAPPHLSVSLERLEAARRGETVFVVADTDVPEGLLQRAWDARRIGATVLAIDAGDTELEQVAHESLTVGREPPSPGTAALGYEPPVPSGFTVRDDGLALPTVSLDTVQHLVSVAAGEQLDPTGRRGFRDRLSRALEVMTGPRDDL